MISDAMVWGLGAAVVVLALIGIGLTIKKFKNIPRRQKPVDEDVAYQARPTQPAADSERSRNGN